MDSQLVQDLTATKSLLQEHGRVALMRRLCVVIALSAVMVLTAGCAWQTHRSSPVRVTDSSPASTSSFPYGFRNVAYKCVDVQGEWFAVFSTSDSLNQNLSGSVSAVPDPKCTSFGS